MNRKHPLILSPKPPRGPPSPALPSISLLQIPPFIRFTDFLIRMVSQKKTVTSLSDLFVSPETNKSEDAWSSDRMTNDGRRVTDDFLNSVRLLPVSRVKTCTDPLWLSGKTVLTYASTRSAFNNPATETASVISPRSTISTASPSITRRNFNCSLDSGVGAATFFMPRAK